MKRTLSIVAVCATISLQANYRPLPYMEKMPTPGISNVVIAGMMPDEVQAAIKLDQQLCRDVNATVAENMAIGYEDVRHTLDKVYGGHPTYRQYKMDTPEQACILKSDSVLRKREQFTAGQVKGFGQNAYDKLRNRNDLANPAMNKVFTRLGGHYQGQ
jgi:hypothetical protein